MVQPDLSGIFYFLKTQTAGGAADAGEEGDVGRERELCIDDLQLRIHFIIKMILVDWPCAMGFSSPFSR